MRELIYRLRYAWHLWRNVQDMNLWVALTYPTSDVRSGDPREDALTEIFYMGQDAG